MGPVGAVGFLGLLNPFQNVFGLCLDVRRLEGLLQQKLMPRLTDEHIKKAGVSARDKVGSIPSASLKHNGNGLRPFFVRLGDTPIPALSLHRVRQHIEYPLIAEPLHHIPHRRLYIEAVVMVVAGDGLFNRLFAGDIGMVGGTVLFFFTVLISVLKRIFINRGLIHLPRYTNSTGQE